MFNPYISEPAQALEPISKRQEPLGGFLNQIRQLDGDDLLVMLILYLLLRDGKQDELWPLLGALMYCIL